MRELEPGIRGASAETPPQAEESYLRAAIALDPLFVPAYMTSQAHPRRPGA